MAVWRGRYVRTAALVGVLLGTAARARAQTAEPSGAPAPHIWYRSSAGCPDGTAFLARLTGRARSARLAQASDRIDFVVTLGGEGAESSGRLERQTEGSTVAVREIRAQSCDDVADVIALTLTLALDPDAKREVAGEPAARATDASEPPPAAAPAEPPAEPLLLPSLPKTPRSDRSPSKATARAAAPPALWLGVRGGAFSGLVSSPGATAGAFVDYAPRGWARTGASARVTALGGVARERTAPPFDLALVAGRLEGCPVALLGADLRLRPCVGLEAGALRVRGTGPLGRSDLGVWVAATGVLRLTWQLSRRFAAEAELGAVVPLRRYAVEPGAPGGGGHRLDAVFPVASLGAALAVP